MHSLRLRANLFSDKNNVNNPATNMNNAQEKTLQNFSSPPNRGRVSAFDEQGKISTNEDVVNVNRPSVNSQYSNSFNTPTDNNQGASSTNPLFHSALNQSKETIKSSAVHHATVDSKIEYEKLIFRVEEQEKSMVT